MKAVSELRSILSVFFKNWNKARLDCFSRLLMAILLVRTVNLREIAVAFEGRAKKDSRYQRIKNFFKGFKFDFDQVARFIFQLFFSSQSKIYLTIDRTNWFLGKKKYNVLVLGIAYAGLSIPILWNWLDKAGNATGKEHLAIVMRFVALFGKECIEGVLGDREFANKTLFEGLSKEQILFYIRIKEGTHLTIKGGKLGTAKKLFDHLNPKEKSSFCMSVWMGQVKIYLCGSRSEKGELMIVASLKSDKAGISKYLRRWETENLFASLKSKGFRLEDTHIQKQDRLEKLMALLAIGFAWAHKIGEWQAEKKPIPFNHHKNSLNNSKRPQYTYFRYGLDFIRECIIYFHQKSSSFAHCLMFLQTCETIEKTHLAGSL